MNAQKTASGTASGSAPLATSTNSRKAWIKKTPVDIVIEQVVKQEEKVATLRSELAHEERELGKLQQARTVLEAT